MGKILTSIIGCWLLVLAIGCSDSKPTEQQLADHKRDIESWYARRIDNLKSHDGWLNLAGLFWLKEGINSFGSAESNDIVFPEGKIADRAGYFMVKGSIVTLTPFPGSDIPLKKESIVFHPDSAKAISMAYGSLEWFIIRRGDKLGIRLRDLESEDVKNFKGIERYPVDYSWKINAKFEPAAEGETIDITTVLGQASSQPLAGRLVFDVDGKEQKLSATAEGDQLFIVFADATNGKETYGAGRFIYVDSPDSTGHSVIDFNKSYNPPCAFTEFATCPLPPKENRLGVSIVAGEKNYETHGKQTSSTL
jgi:uncharacterized protein (DUF1684 family)